MIIIKLLKPESNKKTISNSEYIKKTYKYWRIRIFYSLFVGYIFFYFTRKSFTFSIPLIIDDLHISIKDLGIISTLFYITYGLSRFLSGIISDKSNPRYFMSIGLILTGIFNICFSISSSFLSLSIFWTLNAFFQGWGWPSITKQITYWYSYKERGLIWSICSISNNIGGAIIPILISFFSKSLGWRISISIIGFICIVIGLILINRLRDTPKTLGLPSIEKYKKEKLIKQKNENLTIKKTLINELIKNKIIWLLSIITLFNCIIKTAINDWITLYLINQKGYDLLSAGISIFWFETGGSIGMLIIGFINYKIIKNTKMIIIMTFYFILLVILSIILWCVPVGYNIIEYTLIGFMGFLIFGPQVLIGLMSINIVNKKIACTANGFIGCWSYIGAAITGYPLGLIINYSWNMYFILIITCSLLASIIVIILYNINK